MTTTKKTALFSAITIAVLSATSVANGANSNAPGQQKKQSFADWYKAQNEEKFSDKTDRILLKFKNRELLQQVADEADIDLGVDKNGKKNLKQLEKLAKKVGHELKFVKRSKSNNAVIKLKEHKSHKDMQEIVEALLQDPEVESAEADPKRYLMSQSSPWGIANVQANLVSDNEAGGKKVCIIDSGYDINNPDLSGNMVNGTNNSGTGSWSTPGGSHGSHVAGTIAGINNSEGVLGIMPNQNINLHIIKVFNEEGWGYSSDLSDAIDACANAGADVVNMSLGGASSSTAERNALQATADSGILLVAAAGNAGDSTHSYPASYDSVVSVAAVDETGLRAEFSQYTNQVEVSGPGEAILSSVGVGDGRQAYITFNGSTTGDDRVVPQSRYVQVSGNYEIQNINATVSGVLAACSTSGTSFSCGNMSNKICLVERAENQAGSNYPDINPALACANAGAKGVIIYSNSARPGLQNPFLVDGSDQVNEPVVSVNRSLGQSLLSAVGSNVTLQVEGNTDYAYYNGTSMATPHVVGVAALAWSKNPDCTAAEVRTALKNSTIDLDTSGRDNNTGWGLVQTKAASDYMAANCAGGSTGGGANELTNGVAETGLSGSSGSAVVYTMDVPANATDLVFNMAGGSGDADLYVKFGSEPSSTVYDCRPYKNGNSESCPITTAQAGTYYVKVVAYSAYSGVSLTGSFTENSGGGNTGASATTSNIAASKGNWAYYTLDVPAGMATLNVDIAGGSGDADLHVRFGAQPTTTTYDCRPYKNGNTESCAFVNPNAGTWYIGIRAYSTFSGVTMTTEYQP
jgi:serine protease